MSMAPQPAHAAEAARARPWPELSLGSWRQTCVALHLEMQIVGKIRLALTPKTNQWWNVPFHLTARGLTTSPMPYDGRAFEIEWDFCDHELVVRDTDGRVRSLPLLPRSVAEFERELFAVLAAIGIEVSIREKPVEVIGTTPFPSDTERRAYDADAARRFFEVLARVEPVFETFRSRFRGKCSPVHFFWGSFDLAVTRFSGRRAPPRSGSIIERDAYDEEVISLGFWPGDAWGAFAGEAIDASFYSYTSPEPPGLGEQPVRPAGARYCAALKEFLLPYDAVRRAEDPAGAILEFAESTYDAGSKLAGWSREALAYP